VIFDDDERVERYGDTKTNVIPFNRRRHRSIKLKAS
jgi:hypothetical protein